MEPWRLRAAPASRLFAKEATPLRGCASPVRLGPLTPEGGHIAFEEVPQQSSSWCSEVPQQRSPDSPVMGLQAIPFEFRRQPQQVRELLASPLVPGARGADSSSPQS